MNIEANSVDIEWFNSKSMQGERQIAKNLGLKNNEILSAIVPKR